MKTMKQLIALLFALSLVMAMSLEAAAAEDTSLEGEKANVVHMNYVCTAGDNEDGIVIQTGTGLVVDQLYAVVSRHSVHIDANTKSICLEYLGITEKEFDENRELRIRTAAGDSCLAYILFEDEQADIAVLIMDSKLYECGDTSFISPSEVMDGERCYQLGFSSTVSLPPDNENGVIVVPGTVEREYAMQNTEYVGFRSNDGSYVAGPLVDGDGNIIGFVTSCFPVEDDNIGVAVSSDTLLQFFDGLGIGYNRQQRGTGTNPDEDSVRPAEPSTSTNQNTDIMRQMIW